LLSYNEQGKTQLKSVAFFWEGQNSKPQNYIQYKSSLFPILEEKMRSEGAAPPVELR
jgi:hypothetical protein